MSTLKVDSILPKTSWNSGELAGTDLDPGATPQLKAATATAEYPDDMITITNGGTTWHDHLSVTFTTTVAGTIFCFGDLGSGYENGTVYGECSFLLDGSTRSTVFFGCKNIGAYSAGAGSGTRTFLNVSAGSHTVKLQLRNSGSATWKSPYYGEAPVNTLNVFYY